MPENDVEMVLGVKDYHCIARHLKIFLQNCRNEEVADYVAACVECPYVNGECVPIDPWPSFVKLSSLSGVDLSPMVSSTTD